MFNARRSKVATSKTVGNAEKSNGLSIHYATMRTSTENAIENASPMSMKTAGTGKKKIESIVMIPQAKPISRALLRSAAADPVKAMSATHFPTVC
jgi:hypothetical protein